ncbi:hypothetical protein [Brachybacterium kimchii]|uniref:Uncharacterized protein n=1 Tax=Brachybacterium kimchii TaxID=2942909 RepID=A0ABY4NBB5_9MICO|nr:hypothetical protein [Brachybacterium kimchii]UQN30680.1 hypothetical protein M4486_05090 [Brachybacterium kimchii]
MTDHGSETTYADGCRCDACRNAHRRHMRRPERAATRTDHGTPTCYSAGCRCAPCRTAHAHQTEGYRHGGLSPAERSALRAKAARDRAAKTYPDTFLVLVPLPPRMKEARARRYARSVVLELPESDAVEFSGDWTWRMITRPTGRYIAGRVPARSSRPASQDEAAALAAAEVYGDHVPAFARLVRGEVARSEGVAA